MKASDSGETGSADKTRHNMAFHFNTCIIKIHGKHKI